MAKLPGATGDSVVSQRVRDAIYILFFGAPGIALLGLGVGVAIAAVGAGGRILLRGEYPPPGLVPDVAIGGDWIWIAAAIAVVYYVLLVGLVGGETAGDAVDVASEAKDVAEGE